MAAEGVELLFSMEDLAVVGIFEVITHLPRIKKIFNQIIKAARQKAPAAAVLIDSPDFNLRLAKRLNPVSIPILYYVSPTIWAWRKGRLKIIKKTVNKMMLIFPFEEEIYKEHLIPASFIGHPLLERIKTSLPREEFCKKYGYEPQKKLITLLPGSRKSEIKYHMPILMDAAELIRKEFEVQFAIVLAENLNRHDISGLVPPDLKDIQIQESHPYEALAASDLALSACGTANLEAALLGTPVVSFYRISPLTYYFGIKFIKIKYYSIVNILAGRKIIPELIQSDFTGKNLYTEARKILTSDSSKSEMLNQFQEIREKLGKKKASENAADELKRLITTQSPSLL
jgi:lipid-A-disaccharide synthase